jgi:hypothetical protein
MIQMANFKEVIMKEKYFSVPIGKGMIIRIIEKKENIFEGINLKSMAMCMNNYSRKRKIFKFKIFKFPQQNDLVKNKLLSIKA